MNPDRREPNVAKVLRDDPGERYEKLYGMLMEAIPSSILLIDRDMRIIFTNRNFLERSKRQISSTVGQRLEEVFPPIIFDHMDIARRIREVFEKGQPTRGERMTYKKGPYTKPTSKPKKKRGGR